MGGMLTVGNLSINKRNYSNTESQVITRALIGGASKRKKKKPDTTTTTTTPVRNGFAPANLAEPAPGLLRDLQPTTLFRVHSAHFGIPTIAIHSLAISPSHSSQGREPPASTQTVSRSPVVLSIITAGFSGRVIGDPTPRGWLRGDIGSWFRQWRSISRTHRV